MRSLPVRGGALVAALVLAGSLLAACGSSKTAEQNGAPSGGNLAKIACPLSALPKSGPKVKINFWYADQQGKNKEVMEQIVAAYNASQNRVQVTAADQGQGYTSMFTKYTQSIQNHTIPNVLFADSSYAQFLVDSGTIIPGGSCAKEGVVPLAHIVPVVKAFYTVDGAYIPGAVNMTSTVNYYNQVPFRDAGITGKAPETFAELRADSVKIEKAGIADMKWPISVVASPGLFNTLVTGAGVDIVDHDNGHAGHPTRAVFATPAVTSMLERLQSMYDDGLVAKVSNTPGQLDQYLNVAQGKSAMVIESSAAATTIEAFLGGGLSAQELKDQSLGGLSGSAKVVPGIGEMPGVNRAGQVPVTGGAYYVTNGGSKAQQAAAMDFIRFVNETPQQVKWLIDGSYLSGDARIAEQPEVRKFFSDSLSGMALKVASDQLAHVSPSKSGPLVGPVDQYNRIIQSMMEAMLFNGAKPADALAKAQRDVTAALKSYNSENGF